MATENDPVKEDHAPITNQLPMNATVSALHVYPIKGCRGISLRAAVVGARGLEHDRRWMLADAETGTFLSQRTHPRMATFAVAVADDGALTVACPDADTGAERVLSLPFQADAQLSRRPVRVWSFAGDALDCGDPSAAFFGRLLGADVRLVRVPDDFPRRVKPEYAVTPEDGAGFADAFPLLLCAEPSLADLNRRLAAPLPMNRFRPNMTIEGDFAPWAEDDWGVLRVGSGVTFHAVKPCDRCAVPTIDQETGVSTGTEPLATLATFRRDPRTGKVLFGVNLTPDRASVSRVVRVGDSVTVG